MADKLDWKAARRMAQSTVQCTPAVFSADSEIANFSRCHLAALDLLREMAAMIEETLGCDETDEEVQGLLARAKEMTDG